MKRLGGKDEQGGEQKCLQEAMLLSTSTMVLISRAKQEAREHHWVCHEVQWLHMRGSQQGMWLTRSISSC